VVTETIARIYMQQGNYERAIEAFRTLQAAKPEKHTHFEQLIAECERGRT
jgi:cytochrome c-type biogenesis protein CcmH/NrfG